MHIGMGAKIFYSAIAFQLTKNAAKAFGSGPYPPGTMAHNPRNRCADEWICDASSTKVTRIVMDFRTAFLFLLEWDTLKQVTKEVPQEVIDDFCPSYRCGPGEPPLVGPWNHTPQRAPKK
jgi:hypothetical protein